MIFKNPPISRQARGAISELRVACRLLSMGYAVYTPADVRRDDLVASCADGKWIKIQVKTAKRLGSVVHICLYAGKKRYSPSEVDFFIAVDEDDSFYVIPVDAAYSGRQPGSTWRARGGGMARKYLNRWDLLPPAPSTPQNPPATDVIRELPETRPEQPNA